MHLPVTKTEEQAIIEAIRQAETGTSGEIRVHFQRSSKGKDPLEAAQKAFFKLNMHQTRLRNGVLLFMLLEPRKFVILGDKGINDVVPEHFWEETRDLMTGYFRQGKIAEGLCAGITQAGQKLKAFFPADLENPNELTDELSYDHS